MKPIALLIGACLWLVTAQSGWASYNPSSGRWLNRDPIEEESFQSALLPKLSAAVLHSLEKVPVWDGNGKIAFVFVGNDAINRLDLLGLCDLGTNKCGLAVDQALRLTRSDVLGRFSHLKLRDKAKACAPIWFPTSNYAMAWDMDAMTWQWGIHMPCGAQTCDNTVTVGGKCYNAWDVNYMLYGWASIKCGMSLSEMQQHVILYKILRRDFSRLPGALAFATLGWAGTFSPLPPEVSPIGYPSCGKCTTAFSKDLDSIWP